ncbi:MAG TPA: class A beta-lactamase-related serine hydrolase [Oceanithermus profundus]|uniref:Class A beta-lactamase-related serine hydrolase n=1 Tax=Oceanithermus profundus TaxID=187137 RepID=A0A7C4V5S0_9DEIN|nr:class A beta-lactamase-related serine hydrolase [Oceanithermus profundus]
MKRFSWILTALVLALAACGTPKGPGGLTNHAAFDPAVMEQELRATYEGKVVGFAYAINHKGQLARSGGWGYARRPADGDLPMTDGTRVHLASVSKMVNAVYFLRTLRLARAWFPQMQLGLDDAVWPWLPDGWVQGLGFAGSDGVTFRELLMHTSGLRQMWDAMSEADRKNWGNDWDGLAFVVANGALPIPDGQDVESYRAYKNANHALFRILIPRIYERMGLMVFTKVNRATAGGAYLSFLNSFVMKTVGIDRRVDCRYDRSGNYALYYDLDGPRTQGLVFDREDAGCGGHAGLYMSALELARLLAYARHSDELLGEPERVAMHAYALGWYDRENAGDEASARLRKGGLWRTYYEGKQNNPGALAETRTCVIALPGKVEAVLLINSSLAPARRRRAAA